MSYAQQRATFLQFDSVISEIIGLIPQLPARSKFTSRIRFKTSEGRGTFLDAKPSQRLRRKRMAARSGQRGCITRKGDFWVVRFRIDIPGQFERKHKAVRLCPVEGTGALSKIERQRIALDVIAKEGANSEETFNRTESSSVTFREQSKAWLIAVSNRRRRPVKPHTLRSWKSHLVWLNSKIGDVPLNGH